jgi:hypothetical protein
MLGHERGAISHEEQFMDRSLENRIRERAYQIWTAHGCIDGQADQHWLAAEREILTRSRTTASAEKPTQSKGRFGAALKSPKSRS